MFFSWRSAAAWIEGGIQRMVIDVPLIGLPVDALAGAFVAVVLPAAAEPAAVAAPAVVAAGAVVPLAAAGFGVSVALLPPPHAARIAAPAAAVAPARNRRRVMTMRVPNPVPVSRSDIAFPFRDHR